MLFRTDGKDDKILMPLVKYVISPTSCPAISIFLRVGDYVFSIFSK